MTNSGYFALQPSDLPDASTTYLVPKEVQGQTPNDNDNPQQDSFDAMDVEGRRDTRVQVRVINDFDQAIDVMPVDSHFDDEELEDRRDLESSTSSVASGGGVYVQDYDGEGGRYFGLEVTTGGTAPTSGEALVIFESYER